MPVIPATLEDEVGRSQVQSQPGIGWRQHRPCIEERRKEEGKEKGKKKLVTKKHISNYFIYLKYPE